MGCTNCNKCKSDPCACMDHGLTTPCEYDDCNPNAEPCDEIICAECVSYCGDTFQVPDPLDPTDARFRIEKGERLDQILQKLVIYTTTSVCMDADQLHAVTVRLGNPTSTSVVVSWDYVSPAATEFNVYWSITSGVWVLANLGGPLSALTTSYNITGLNPATTYLIKVETGDGASTCDSVEVQTETLL